MKNKFFSFFGRVVLFLIGMVYLVSLSILVDIGTDFYFEKPYSIYLSIFHISTILFIGGGFLGFFCLNE